MAYELTIGKERERFRTEREAVIAFCEFLSEDATRYRPEYPVGTELTVVNSKGETLLRYVVGYR